MKKHTWLGDLGTMLVLFSSVIGTFSCGTILYILFTEGLEIPLWTAVFRFLMIFGGFVLVFLLGRKLRKKYGAPKKESSIKLNVESKAYTVVLAIMLFLCVYIGTFSFAISPENGEFVKNFLLSQSILFLLTGIMLFKRIRYAYRHKIVPKPKVFVGKIWKAFKRFAFPLKTRYTERERETALEKKIGEFQREYASFYEGGFLRQNVTQMYQHLLMLHKNRLEKLQLTLNLEYKKMGLENKPAMKCSEKTDGKFRHIHLEEYLSEKKSFFHKNKKIYTSRNEIGAGYDVIGMRTRWMNGKCQYTCPSCGAEEELEQLMTGCPYCGTKFLIEELDDRICNLSLYNDYYLKKSLAGLRLDRIVNWSVILVAINLLAEMLTFIIPLFASAVREIPAAIMMLIGSVVLTSGLFFVVCYCLAIPLRLFVRVLYRDVYEARTANFRIEKNNQEMVSKLNGKISDFSLNSFFSNVRNKVAAIHYAENEQSMQVYTILDLQRYAEKYADVAECLFGPMELLDYQTVGDLHTAKIRVSLELVCWNGKYMEKKKERLEIELQHREDECTKNPYGIHSPKCSQCGAPIDLLKSNQCHYCGTKLDFLHLDWCITKYMQI